MKKIIILLFFAMIAIKGSAQEKIYQINEITVLNYGDGRLLYRENNDTKAPLNGEHRIISGYSSEYILAQFKDGMYDGKYQHFKNNKLIEEGVYAAGRKNGLYRIYTWDGKTLEKETPYCEDKINGELKTYYIDGSIETQKSYKMSVQDGMDCRYEYQTRKILHHQNYHDGKLHGRQMVYKQTNMGNFIEIINYDNDVPVGEYMRLAEDGVTVLIKGQHNERGQKDGDWFIRDYKARERKNYDPTKETKIEKKVKKVIYKDNVVIKEQSAKEDDLELESV